MPTKVGAVWCWAAVSPAVMLDKTPTRHDEVNINPLVYKLHNVAIRRHLDTKIALFCDTNEDTTRSRRQSTIHLEILQYFLNVSFSPVSLQSVGHWSVSVA